MAVADGFLRKSMVVSVILSINNSRLRFKKVHETTVYSDNLINLKNSINVHQGENLGERKVLGLQ